MLCTSYFVGGIICCRFLFLLGFRLGAFVDTDGGFLKLNTNSVFAGLDGNVVVGNVNDLGRSSE